jgi:anion-transporting  ArsA/GET3 family ATPase
MLNAASRPFYSIADRLLGSKFLQEIAEFFLNFQSMYDGFVQRAQSVERLLRDRVTTFAVVTTLEAAPLDEAEDFIDALRERRLHLGALVLNRVLPDYFRAPGATDAAARFVVEADKLGAAVAAVEGAPAPLADASRDARVLRTIGESFQNFALVAAREAELRHELHSVPDVVVTVPSSEGEISDIAGLAWISRHILS